MTSVTPQRHTLLEDVQALLSATLMIALAINLYRHAELLTGGTAGLAFLAQYGTRLSFGQAFFLINLPFYWLAVKRLGWAFTLRTLAAVTLVSLFTELTPRLVTFQALQPLYAAVIGGVLMGVGLLILFRHRASLGGINIAVLYLQDRYGWRAGKIQMGIDCLIVLLALFVVAPGAILTSILGAVILNLTLAINHRPGRYSAIS
ncbi:YitT family protein [Pseudomonas oryzihabitans]|uniref:YitT family protein n=1 Tax=Pseudomonas oryzihabitans TaxID=47885 RepID=UPI0011A09513|nr:YitT family protein [Pseudomonas psychrotolerans]